MFLKFASLLLLTLAWAGCQSSFSGRETYYRVRVTDPRGVLVADWVAEGKINRNETRTGYRFRAVERLAGGSNPQRSYYPRGRIVEASGPNIIIARCGQPYWLYEMQQGSAAYEGK